MSTLPAPFIQNGVVREWEDEYPSATFSGIVGDEAHRKTGGYHISIEDQPPTNYSVIRPDDKAPPGTWSRKHATALDMSMNKADMVKSTRRWMLVWSNRADPRRKFFNGFNGWTGSGDAQRWDFVTNTVKRSTNDHQWHQHTEKRRKYWNDPQADRAMISIARGQTVAQWLAQEAGGGSGADNVFCAKNDTGNNPLNLQIQLVQMGYWVGPPDASDRSQPYNYCDGEYGSWTASALKEALGDPNNNGEKFGPWEYRALEMKYVKMFGTGSGGGGGLVPHTHDITGLTVTVTGSGTGNGATGPAKAA